MDTQKPQPKRRYRCFQLQFSINETSYTCIAAATKLLGKDVLTYLQEIAQKLERYDISILQKVIRLIEEKDTTPHHQDPHIIGFMSSETISANTLASTRIPVVMKRKIQENYLDKPTIVIGMGWDAFQELKNSEAPNDYWKIPPPSMN